MVATACPECATQLDESHRFCPSCGRRIVDEAKKAVDPLIGTTLPGGFTLLETVGVGGMGRVYRAEQRALGRTVAVKIIHPHLLGDESASARFITEARATSRLNHPNSVGVIDFGKTGEQLYLVMEFLRGRDLARVLEEDGMLPFRRVIDILVQVLAALGEAHALEIIHRDLKPENIVLEPMRSGGDFVKVVDFGLAKMKQEAQPTNVTSPGIVCGTPDYMAPEQGRGDPIDARSDLYACGVILFQLLTGRLPFESESPTQVVLMHMAMPLPDPAVLAPERKLPPFLVSLTKKALEKEPADRYQSAEEFATALAEARVALDPPAAPRAPLAPRPVTCLVCGTAVPLGQKFCGECGARIAGANRPPPMATPSAPPVAERASSTSIRLPLPFVAREGELAWLGARRAAASASMCAARLVGEQGAGKSRLMREFLMEAAKDGDIIVETGPDPWWAQVGLHAVRVAIVKLAALPDDGGDIAAWSDASPDARRGLAEVFGRAARTSRAGASLWSLDAADPSDAVGRRIAAAEALRWALAHAARLARGRRIILAIDDLHAVDGASRNALLDVIVIPPRGSFLVLGAHVPGFDPVWESPACEVVGLPTSVAAALARGRQPPAVSERDRSLTVPPLYADQVVRFGLEGGTAPPPRLADLISLRIERLAPDSRRVLQAVAVIGDHVDRPTLRHVLGDEGDIEAACGLLLARGFLTEVDEPGASRRVRTAHSLVRDVTLATIPAEVRRELHAGVGTARGPGGAPLPLEVRAAQAFNAELAFDALMLLEQVADRAASRGDSAGNVAALRRGLDLARREVARGNLDDPMRAVLIFSRKLGDALARLGALADAEGLLREALDLAGDAGDARAMILASLAFVAHKRSRNTEASNYLRDAKSTAELSTSKDLLRSLERMESSWQTR